jgi:predicted nucleotidyltransferase
MAVSHLDEARSVAKRVGGDPDVHAVCLLGSGARGDADPGSDIDVLALVRDQIAAAHVRAEWRSMRERPCVQLRVVSEGQLARLFERRTTFAVHVLREAAVVTDRYGRFAELSAAHSLDQPVRDDGAQLSIRLEPYATLGWTQGLYLYCLSDLYSIGRAATLTILGRRSEFVFSAPEAFHLLASSREDLRGAVGQVVDLKPFYLLAERDVVGPLPFPYRDCHAEVCAARDACRLLVAAIA